MTGVTLVLLAFAVAGTFAGLALVIRNFPRTAGLFLPKSWAFWAYCGFYGLLAGVALLLVGATEEAGVIGLPYVTITNAYAKASLVGLLVAGGQSFLLRETVVSVGRWSRTVTPGALVEPVHTWLLGHINLDHHYAVRAYIASRLEHYPDLAEVRRRVRDHVPAYLPKVDIAAFVSDIEDDNLVRAPRDVMDRFLFTFGRTTFDMAFPVPREEPAERGRVHGSD